jgi:formylglycine-generating enzyme required for sulfatase activity
MCRYFLTLLLLLLSVVTAHAADKYALLVGVTKYEHSRMNDRPLKYPEADATAVAQALQRGGYEVLVLNGSKATQAAITDALKVLERQSNTDGVVLIGLFGHGVQYGETAYFCPFDTDVRTVMDSGGKVLRDSNGKELLEPDPATLISMRSLLDSLTKSKAGSRVLLADCCREDPSAARGRNAFGSSLTTADLPDRTAALFACSRDEQAFEHDDWQHGAFTRSLLNQLEQIPARGLRAGALAEQVHDEVLELVRDKAREKQTVTALLNGIVDLQLKPASRRQVVTNSIGMKLVLIPAGEFLMGSPEGEEGRNNDGESPQHRVRISKPFYLGETEVTQEQFRAVMNAEPWKSKTWVQENGRNAASYIDHNDATEFCRRLSQREGKTYRLPREAEWEYACRGGTTTRFHFGDDESRLGEYAWFGGNAYDKDENYAHAVRQKKPNPFGLYDMHGNVHEWCADWYDYEYYASSPGTDPTGPSSGSSRVLRGGAWGSFPKFSNPYDIRCASRGGNAPYNATNEFGFRVLLE